MKRPFRTPTAEWAKHSDLNYEYEQFAGPPISQGPVSGVGIFWAIIAILLLGWAYTQYQKEEAQDRQQADADVLYYSATDPRKARSIRCANARTPEARMNYCTRSTY